MVVASIVAAIAVFLVVQDRLTAAGARDYVARQGGAAAGQMAPVTIDEVMRPAVARSVRVGLLWAGVVLAAGLAAAAAVRPIEGRRRERPRG
jgi:hypothetical protein